MDLLELWGFIRDGGVAAVLLLALVGGFRGWYVWGWYAKELRDQIEKLEIRLDRAERVAERGTGLAQRAVDVVERHSEVPRG